MSAATDNIFARLGRTSLLTSTPAAGTEVSSDTASSNLGRNLGVSFGLDYGGNALGRLSAGLAGVIVLGLVGFYVWTRSHQA